MSFLRSMLVHNDQKCAGTGGAIFESRLTARGRTWHVQSRTIHENAHFFQDIHSVTISLLFLTSSYFLAFFQLALFPQPGCRIFSIFLPPFQTTSFSYIFQIAPTFSLPGLAQKEGSSSGGAAQKVIENATLQDGGHRRQQFSSTATTVLTSTAEPQDHQQPCLSARTTSCQTRISERTGSAE